MTKELVESGRTCLAIEIGSTRIKACLINAENPTEVLATGFFEWENIFADGYWTYSLDSLWAGIREAYASLAEKIRNSYKTEISTISAIGISAMMHGYLAFDNTDNLLVPFRTWRNTNTQAAAEELSEKFSFNIPMRWSIAHLHQAILNKESHINEISSLNTLAGYVHFKLTGKRVLGVGDASGMFPVDSTTCDYDQRLIDSYDEIGFRKKLRELFPRVLVAGEAAGKLTKEGSLLLDPTGKLSQGIPFCPPEGDAGTGMVATNAVAPRTGNVSAGTSIFAMVVLEGPLSRLHQELDLVTTPNGDAVAMVHCNNGASELNAWARIFSQFARVSGNDLSSDIVFEILFNEALSGNSDAGGVVAYNFLAAEPIAGIETGRPLLVRLPDADFSLANVIRAQLYSAFATLALGMDVLKEEKVAIDVLYAHGGVFRTKGVAQKYLAAALNVPVAVSDQAPEGGAWGMAVLAAFRGSKQSLTAFLNETVFKENKSLVVSPEIDDINGFRIYINRYLAGLSAVSAAAHIQ